MNRVVVIGGGLGGLAAAFRLRQLRPDAAVTVLEASDRVGGNVGTRDRAGFRFEIGPNGFLDGKPSTLQLCRDLGLGDRLVAGTEEARTNRFLFLNNTLHRLPGSPGGLLRTPVLSWRGKLAMLAEPFRPPRRDLPDESVAAFARRRFGREAADTFVDALVTGIHAGDPERLSVRSAFPRLWNWERESGGVLRGVLAAGRAKRKAAQTRGEKPAPQRMWSFREGLQLLIDALRDQCGAEVLTGIRVRRVEPGVAARWRVVGDGADRWDADAVILAQPAYEQALALEALDPALAVEMAAVRYNRVAVVALGYRRRDVAGPQDGFGFIAPQNSRRDVLGVQWCSSIYPERAPDGLVLWRALCGGVGRDDVFDLDDATLVAAVQREMRASMGVTGEPVFTEVVRWPKAIPQLELGHAARLGRIEAALARHAGLFLAGNSYHGVAMNDVTERSEGVAAEAAAFLSEPEA